ncbi:hypothetical protein WR25_15561 [Diploscapter pachys]|uniref:Uncharacterized protein n=1 Tax=Diploscapter pachys TaxID=2018661 RepID=A0A2A2JW34_9BILA|nr:hypothetical protein WR25_15561 [Diploscapter pachys]
MSDDLVMGVHAQLQSSSYRYRNRDHWGVSSGNLGSPPDVRPSMPCRQARGGAGREVVTSAKGRCFCFGYKTQCCRQHFLARISLLAIIPMSDNA